MHDRPDVLEAALRSVATRVAFPPTPPVASTVVARLRADSARAHRPPFPATALWSRRRLVLAVVLGLLLLGGAAVAARLSIGAVEVRVAPSLAPSAPPEAPAAFGTQVTLERAVGETGIEPGWPSSLGRPDDVYVLRPGGAVTSPVLVLAWRDLAGDGTIPNTPWSAVLFELRGQLDVATKTVLARSISPARVDGEPAFWIEGAHDLGLEGAFGGEVVRVSGNVLLWEERSAGLTYRLETMLPRAEAIALAETLP
jgi:hypothetical protein